MDDSKRIMRVLIACEESQRVCSEFRRLGQEAYSCDIIECSGGHPEWHIMGDVLPLIDGNCSFQTMDSAGHAVSGRWDLIIAHPPCTYLTVAGNAYFNVERYGDKAIERMKKSQEAAEFFMKFVNADCDKIAIENPVGRINTLYRKPDQIIHPYHFGHPVSKKTCLWLKGLPELKPRHTTKPELAYHEWITPDGKKKRQTLWYYKTRCLQHSQRATAASKTFHGIAKAMAEQWAGPC